MTHKYFESFFKQEPCYSDILAFRDYSTAWLHANDPFIAFRNEAAMYSRQLQLIHRAAGRPFYHISKA